MTPDDRWQLLSDWLSGWLEADPQARVRLRDELAVSHPELVGEADRMISSVDTMTGFLETPALVLAARELAVDAPVLSAGVMIGPYRVVRLLARGGMGDVYRATDSRLGRDVALKVLSPARTSDPRRVERFLMEARVTASLDHPNIVRVYDVGRVDEQAYLVAELLDGETLRARILRGAIAPEEARRIALDVARGLAAAHEAGLVHRDLKPENIFLTRNGETKLLDFGIAKLTQDEAVPDGVSTLTGVVLGTAGYLAPEQIRGDTVDGRADLFAFGAVLFEILTGTRAFVRDQIVDTLHAILHDPPALVLEHRPGIPPSLAAIVGRLLQKAPDARFQSASELIGALERADVGRTRSWPARQISRLRTGLKRPVWAAAAATIAVGVVLVVFWLSRPAEIVLAVLPFRTDCSRVRCEPTDNTLFDLGLTAVLIDRLGQLPNVSVLPLSATERYAKKSEAVVYSVKDAVSAGRELAATHVLTGAVRRQGSAMGAMAQLVTIDTGQVVFFPVEEAGSSIFTFQEIITNRVVDVLAPNLNEAIKARLQNAGTQNVEAWKKYLTAQGQLAAEPGALKKAEVLFHEATKLDPGYADAWAGLASALKRQPVVADARPRETFEQARSAALKALELQPDHPEATSTLGTVAFWYEWDYSKAIERLKEALARKRDDPDSQLFLAHVYSNIGRHDLALREIRIASSFDPLWSNPGALQGQFLFQAGQYQESLRQLDDVIKKNSGFWLSHLFKAVSLLALHRYEEAIDACNRVAAARQFAAGPVKVPMYSQALAYKGYALAKLGKKADATEIVRELDGRTASGGYVPQSLLALLLRALGDEPEAFKRLRTAVADRDVLLAFIGVSPLWDDWRTLPEFKEAAKAANLLDVSEATRQARR